MKVDFADESCILGDDVQGVISQALSNATAISNKDSTSQKWWTDIHTMNVQRSLGDGRSGARVLELEAVSARRRTPLVAKLMTFREADREYSSYLEALKDDVDRFALYVRIEAVSHYVVDGDSETSFPLHAVIYQHVRDRDPRRRGTLRSLEDIASATVRGEEPLADGEQTVADMMDTLAHQLYGDVELSPEQELSEENLRLGADLTLEVDGIEQKPLGALRLLYGRPGQADLTRHQVYEQALLAASTEPAKASDSLNAGERAHVWLEHCSFDGRTLTGRQGQTTVCVALTGEAADDPSLLENNLAPTDTVEVYGMVRVKRPESWSVLMNERVDANYQGFTEDASSIACQGVRVHHPIRSLRSVLRAPAAERPQSRVHGDLNPRNILFCDANPYLIDYASYKPKARTLADLAWLEVCLLRDVCGPVLGWSETVRVVRALNLLSRLLHVWPQDEVSGAASFFAQAMASGPASNSLALIWQVRLGAWKITHESLAERWSDQYLQELSLAACRTFKWGSENEAHAVAASAIVAGTASECLTPESRGELAPWEPEEAQIACKLFADRGELEGWRDGDLLLSAAARGLPARGELMDLLMAGPLHSSVEALQVKCQTHRPAGSRSAPDATYIPLEGRLLAVGEPLILQGEGALSLAQRDVLQLLEEQDAVVLLADSGSGKSLVTRELRLRLFQSLLTGSGSGGTAAPGRGRQQIPLAVSALKLNRRLGDSPGDSASSVLRDLSGMAPDVSEKQFGLLMRMGALHVTVDDLHKVEPGQRPAVVRWLKNLRKTECQLGLVICQRSLDYQPEQWGWPAVVIHKVRAQPARTFIEEELRRHMGADWLRHFKIIEDRLFDDAEAAALRDLAGKPLFLSMLVHHYREHGRVDRNPGILVHEYLARLFSGPTEDRTFGDFDPVDLLKALVRRSGSLGGLSRSEAVSVFEALNCADPATLLDKLLDTSAVLEESGTISFCNPLVQTFCAALVLADDASTDLDGVLNRIVTFAWREAAVLLASDPDTDQDMLLALVQRASDASAWYGALMLQAVPDPVSLTSIRQMFLEEQRRVLMLETSGRPAWRQSAYALARYGSAEALQLLEKVALSGRSPAEAVEAALDGLVMMHRWFVPGASATLPAVLQDLLEPAGQRSGRPSITARALRSVLSAGLRELSTHVAAYLSPANGWPVVSQAWQTLTELQMIPTRSAMRLYGDACRSRLTEIAKELSATAATQAALLLSEERLELLRFLATQGDIETLLTYRFRAGLSEFHEWQQLLQKAAEVRRRQDEPDLLAAALLSEGDPQEWRTRLGDREKTWAAVAAHHLLSGDEAVELPVLIEMSQGADAERLSIIASLVHYLPSAAGLDELIRPHLPELTGDKVEPLACLVAAAMSLDPREGRRLALQVHQALVSRNLQQEALHWPWCTTWRRAMPVRAEIGTFLKDCTDVETLASLLGSADVLLDAPRTPRVFLSQAARKQLIALKPEECSGMRAYEFVLLAASAGLVEALPFVHRVATDSANLNSIVRHSHGIHGVQPVSAAAHALSAIGYLERLAAENPGQRSSQSMYLPELRRMVTDGEERHASVKRACNVGLAYWGEWRPLLLTLTLTNDPVLDKAAHNIVNHWLPGPHGSSAETVFAEVAHWISETLNDPELPPDRRGVLGELRDVTENKLRRYVH
ncbi:hypothetical protein ABT040_15985 [Streptomyces sp. NPDC002688]|uniref:hypothetical protein n=1 Tax=Streptomyces sp. NPDC002688 TaxID=3154423 RepID=UPI00331C2E58